MIRGGSRFGRRDDRIELVTADLPTDEYLRMFAAADVCLAPSRWEGLGLHLFEATALGLPILTNDNPPMNEVVIDGMNGLLVPGVRDGNAPRSGIAAYAPDIVALTAAIERIADDGLRAELAAGARTAARGAELGSHARRSRRARFAAGRDRPMSVTHDLYDATWGRFFAATYERLMKDTEEAGMRERRRGLLAQARGTTVELGAGTGLNFGHYPEAVTEIVLTEPFEPMARQLRERVEGGQERPVNVSRPPRTDSRLDDASAETVVCTLVLCTVDDVPGTLAEVARVLKPGGRLLFAEHVRSAEPGVARWQDRLEGPWKSRPRLSLQPRHLAAIEGSALKIESVDLGSSRSRRRSSGRWPSAAPGNLA